ncbi:MAG TPA: 2-hydroxymuconate tautomerase [Sedimentibacter sp.]|jgi:4-oxalocrotonate tautomerase|nr:2-hydroxymuconate tautomerase family protein [Tissierellia bacterium]HPB79728.1 2-hydroxymuconate tautomerase [Sedimentibacter sp.]HQO71461.1 2-hydroxymuconate tautomerase [Sedimentibacter sp.]HQO95591.1 2-hydroxymuconate tautomerase [Sedimentibacter sp.]
MPIIQVEMLKGRTVDQKREMVKEITEVVSRTANCPKEAVRIVIREMEFENFGINGQLQCDI